MDPLQHTLQIIAAGAGGLALVLGIPLFVPFRWPAMAVWVIKIIVSALSLVFAFVGFVTTIVGLITDSLVITCLGIAAVLVYTFHYIATTRPPRAATGFEQAFGANWKDSIGAPQQAHFLPGRTTLALPSVPKPRMTQNIPFASIPGTDRKLLCDVWQPAENVRPSGLALIYLFGSAWYILDKDFGTRPFFKHLAAQGHVIMDVAYRLAPETDMMGMVHDVKRAIAWMKEQADVYGIDPKRILVSGGSAGAHLALMAAYTSNDPKFTPTELEGKDISVCGVISIYGQSDLTAMYYHTNQQVNRIPGKSIKTVPSKTPKWIVKAFGKDYHRLGFDKDFAKTGSIATLLNGHPNECPERYAQFSPITHVHAQCPPTLLIHGAHDIMAPVKAIRRLHSRLVEEQVPTVLHILPQTDHGFDLAFPKIAPAAHNAIYDVERFMAVMATRELQVQNESTAHKRRTAYRERLRL